MRVKSGDPRAVAYVQLYGERNSGTTYLARLLQDNMAAPQNLLGLVKSDATPFGTEVFGYKHWFPDPAKLADPKQAETLFVTIYRNPYTWLRAMMDRPYALEKSIGGQPVAALPDIRLVGHMKGRDTRNEQDPQTGEALTIFELRARKIAHFEALAGRVDNLARINLETFLDDPQALIRALAAEFPKAFRADLQFERAPYRKLIEEYHDPQRFAPDEQALIDAALDWDAEAQIGYRRGDYALPQTPPERSPKANAGSPARIPVLVLHGGSGVGKTYLMNRLCAGYSGLFGIEMDSCKYWQDDAPEFVPGDLATLLPGQDPTEFTNRVASLGLKGRRCIPYLLNQLKTALEQTAKPGAIIATCGALPDPAPAGSIYSWLADHLPLRFHHLLIDIPQSQHRRQIDRRGRTHLKEQILTHHARKIASRDHHDATLSGYDQLAAYLTALTGAEPRKSALSSAPILRCYKRGLHQIQIFGERNSGTKYLKSLLTPVARNPDAILGAYANKTDPVNKARLIGYKHYYPRPEKLARHQAETLFVVIYKNPYTWCRSMLAKPYHFRASLEGKEIADLPHVKLAGVDRHGRAIPDVHPETGANLTLFELRRHKIAAWEALKDQVGHVAYVSYEDLLVAPSEALGEMIAAFGSAFAVTSAPEITPDPHYLLKYLDPEPFSREEMTIMDAHIDWEMEAQVGYRRGDLVRPGLT